MAVGIAGWGLALLAATASLLLAGWLTLHWGFLPRVDAFRPQIESRLSAALGVPVRLGALEAQAYGLTLSLRVHDVRLLDASGAEALVLPRVEARLSPRAWVRRTLVLDRLDLDDASLEVRRDALGRWHVAGLPLDPDGASPDGEPSPSVDWLFSQRHVVVRGASVRWVDETRPGAAPLALRDVQVVLRNGLRHHDLRLDATPPAGWGARFTVQGRFTQELFARPGDLSRWSGSVHADLPEGDLAELRAYVDLPFELREGHGALRAWAEVRSGTPVSATADVALRAVALRLSPRVEPLEFLQVQGRLQVRRDADGMALQASRFGFTTGDGIVWPASDALLSWRQASSGQAGDRGQPILGGEFSAEHLDLGVMSSIASRLPLGDAVHGLLETLRPAGVVQRLAGRWEGPPDRPWRYQVEATAAEVSLAAGPVGGASGGHLGRPGLAGATVSFRASERGGEAALTMQRGELVFPGLFDEPRVPMNELEARLAWTVVPTGRPDEPPRVELQVKGARFANADARGQLDLHWHTGPGQGHASGGRWPGHLDLAARLDGGRVDRVARYLPRALPTHVRGYLQRALRSGDIEQATIEVRGDLWDFPYVASRGAPAPAGEFRIAAQVHDAQLAYVPDEPASAETPGWTSPWPAMSDVRAEVTVDRAQLTIRDGRARIGRVELAGVQGRIADLVHDATLEIDGRARGAAQDLLGFVSATPVRTWTRGALETLRASGNAELRLALRLPLTDLARSTVDGAVRLEGNDLRFRPDVPLLAAARGLVEFTERSLGLTGASVQVAGGEASVEGGLLPDGRLQFTANGTATAEGLRQTPELGLPAPLLRALSGEAPYRLQLGFRDARPEWLLTSPLTGMAAALPAPLDKAREATLPLRVEVALQDTPRPPPPDSPSGGSDELRVDLGDAIQARYWREPRGDAMRVVRGAIAVGEPLADPGDGVIARVRLPALDLDAWRAASEAGAAAEGERVAAADYLPNRVTLRAGELRTFERQLTAVDLRAASRNGSWRAEVTSDQIAGQLEWNPDGDGHRLRARLARLVLPRSDVDSVERLLSAPPATLPALDVVVDDFILREHRLGRLEIEAANRPVGGGLRDWRLTRLALANPDARLVATGHWNAVRSAPGGAPQRVTALDFMLDVSDSGSLLERLGQARTLRGGQGRLSGQVQWAGSPLDPAFSTMNGSLELDLDRGQFLRADPGAARLLGVLSLQALPRRLALDFRDVFQEGFSFDEITGAVRIDQGVARTNNLRMRGVQAAVLMDGSADLRTETQQLRVVVVPEINAGTASLAYATINPAIGLGTFLAQVFLRKPLAEAGTREFRISGSWADPKVERVERGVRDEAAPPSNSGEGTAGTAVAAPPARPGPP
ncbi:MAG: TIGR02099 family protein [Ideonella sp.]|nr:TIGR02099 family protein [Ideonella sp.]